MINLSDILKEDEVSDVFGDAPFAEYTAYAKRLGTKIKSTNTKEEDKILDALGRWTNGDYDVANFIYKNKDLFKNAAKKYPRIFAPDKPNGTIVYRGLHSAQKIYSLIDKDILKITKGYKAPIPKENYVLWKNLVVRVKPLKYNPHRKIQSFSYDLKVAGEFASNGSTSAILIKKQNSEFLFNTWLFKYPYTANEQEILHFGDSLDVTVALDFATLSYYMADGVAAKTKKLLTKVSDLSGIVK